MRIQLFEVVYVNLPFPDHTTIETLSSPFWRLLADDCVLLFQTEYVHIDLAMKLLPKWGGEYVTAVPTHPTQRRDPVIVGSRGKARYIWDLSYDNMVKGVFKATEAFGTNRLAINVVKTGALSPFADWQTVPATGNKMIDPYRYPLRKNGLEWNETVLDLIAAINHEHSMKLLAEWKMLEKMSILLVNSEYSPDILAELVSEATNGYWSKSKVARMFNLILRFHNQELEPNYSKPLDVYVRELKQSIP